MDLKELLKQTRYRTTVIDENYFEKRTNEMFEQAMAKIEFEKRWKARHGENKS